MNSPPHVPSEASRLSLPESIKVQGTLITRLGIEFTEVRSERVAASMPVEGNTQPAGLLHGGASAALAETVASIAAALHGAPDHLPVGVDLNATHHRAVRSGSVHAVATPLHLGRRIATYQVEITDDSQKLVCSARLSCFFVPASG